MILGSFGNSMSSFSSRIHLETSLVLTFALLACLEETERGEDAAAGFDEVVAGEAGQLVQLRDEGLVDLGRQLGRAILVHTVIAANSGMHVMLLRLGESRLNSRCAQARCDSQTRGSTLRDFNARADALKATLAAMRGRRMRSSPHMFCSAGMSVEEARVGRSSPRWSKQPPVLPPSGAAEIGWQDGTAGKRPYAQHFCSWN